MNILELIQVHGVTLRKVAATNGGEYAGPCPFCGGKDRFRAWPSHRGGRYWCRQCGKWGDTIQYLRECQELSFIKARNFLGLDSLPRSKRPRPSRSAWQPLEPKIPLGAWQAKAKNFLEVSIDYLWSQRGIAMRKWLHREKGLSDATIKAAGLGFNPPAA